jgi:hypothetical protein
VTKSPTRTESGTEVEICGTHDGVLKTILALVDIVV